ncbi:MAG: type I restriction endonuclease [Steroidobacteraceae bacterium]
MTAPETKARAEIDRLLTAAGWHVCDFKLADLHAARGVAIREFELKSGHGTADYLLYIDGKAAGVVEAKKQGATLTGVERQSDKYAKGLPTNLPAWAHPLPFAYESTGVETRSPMASTPNRARGRCSRSTVPRRWPNGCVRQPRTTPRPSLTTAASCTASARCRRSSPSGASTNSGPPRSPPSAIWKPASHRTSRAR